MTEDIRRDADRADGRDRRDQQVDASRADEQPVRRDDDVAYTDNRPLDRDDARQGEPARDADDVIHDDDAQRRDPATADRAVASDGEAGRIESRDDDRDTHRDPTSERRPSAGPGTTTAWSEEGLLSSDDRGSYQQRWDDIQVRFIDEPRQCVREADDLVDEVTTRIADRFSSARQDMEQRWDSGNEPTTEELRQAVQRYRDFFQRLVAQ